MNSRLFQFLRPISISLSPNTETDDVRLAFKLLFQPWRWKTSAKSPASAKATAGKPAFAKAMARKQEKREKILEEEFQKYLGVKHAFAFNSGRSAFMAILDGLGLQKGDEILLQAFTCNAVPNPVIWSGLRPVYVDCSEDDFNIDAADLKRKITPRSKVVVVQHTFGLPADMEKVTDVCQMHDLILVEDCAHALGAKYKGRLVGTFGKASFFSFSRDKVISSVYGGMAATDDDALAEKIGEYQEKAGYPSSFWIFQQLLHPVAMNWKILPTYRMFGKYLLIAAQQLRLLSKAVHWKEKRGMKPGYFPGRMPNALAQLALHQLEKLERLNEHRKQIAGFYYKALQNSSFGLPKNFEERENIFLRFALEHARAHELLKKAWARNLLLGDWYTSPVAPDDTRLDKVAYERGSCPKAEKLSRETLNLPTHIHISEKEVICITKLLKSFDKPFER